jgi:peptide/nickel transport system ATP-binding protein
VSLVIKNLTLSMGCLTLLDDICLTIGNEKVALIGESGSGKSMLAKTILGVQPKAAKLSCRALLYNNKSLLNLTENEWQQIRGKEIAMIMQDPKASLNPLMRIGAQLDEVAVRLSVDEALDMVLLPSKVSSLYPHELSGGMGQRVMIAMMLMQRPKVILADEIVSALDYTCKDEIILLLKRYVEKEKVSLLYITHDIAEALCFCDTIAVMYQGKLVALDSPDSIKTHAHPYVQHLLNATLEAV